MYWLIKNELNYWKSWLKGPTIGYNKAKQVLTNIKRLEGHLEDITENKN